MNKRFSPVLVAVAAVVFSASAFGSDRIDREFHESFEVSPGARLDLDHGDGDVELSVWEKDVIQVDVIYRADYSGVVIGSRGDFDVRFEQRGDTVRVEGLEPEFRGITLIGSFRSEYRYTIQAPSYVELELRGEDGDVEIEGWRAPIALRLDDGDVVVRDVEADSLRLHVEDGDVRVFGVNARLEIEADDGDVDLVDCMGGTTQIDVKDGDVAIRRCATDLTLTTDDGDVRISQLEARLCDIRVEDGNVDLDLAPAEAAEIELRSDDGNLTVTFAPGLNADLDLSYGDGRVRLDLAGGDLSRGEHHIRGRVGSGPNPARVRVSTQDGNVTLRERG